MAVEKKLLKKSLNNLQVKRFLHKELERAGVSDIEMQKTPIATRISIKVRRPAVVVGKRGRSIKDLCDLLEKNYGIENPQIEVIQVEKPELDAKIMAEKIGKRIEAKPQVKPIMRIVLKEIMEAGALGVEIRVAGKIVGKGGKAKTLTVRKGFLKKSGESLKMVNEGRYTARLSAGAVGITVKILPPWVNLGVHKTKQQQYADMTKARAEAAEIELKAQADKAKALAVEAVTEKGVEEKLEVKEVEGAEEKE